MQPVFVCRAPLTFWYCFNETANRFDFNHVEDGHVITNKPIPKYELQKGWLKKTWRRYHGYSNLHLNSTIKL